jgi:CheY-like chemotaxis protein
MTEVNTHNQKIVIIDDDTFLLDMYVTKFKKSGYQVLAFASAQDALDKIKDETDIDAVIFDIIMPGMDGWSFAAEYRKQDLHPSAKFVILSNQSKQSDIDQSKDLRVDLFIVKALKTPSEVVNEINAILS